MFRLGILYASNLWSGFFMYLGVACFVFCMWCYPLGISLDLYLNRLYWTLLVFCFCGCGWVCCTYFLRCSGFLFRFVKGLGIGILAFAFWLLSCGLSDLRGRQSIFFYFCYLLRVISLSLSLFLFGCGILCYFSYFLWAIVVPVGLSNRGLFLCFLSLYIGIYFKNVVVWDLWRRFL